MRWTRSCWSRSRYVTSELLRSLVRRVRIASKGKLLHGEMSGMQNELWPNAGSGWTPSTAGGHVMSAIADDNADENEITIGLSRLLK